MNQALSDLPLVRETENCTVHGPWVRSYRQAGVWYGQPACPSCRREFEARQLLGRRASWPARYNGCEFGKFHPDPANPQQRKALDECRRYASAFSGQLAGGRCMILCGNHGTGKTHLSVSICKEVTRQGYTAAWITAADLIDRIRSCWGTPTSSADEKAIIRQFVQLDLLVIDEVGKTKGSESEQNLFFRVIDGRYLEIRPTIVVSNLDKDGVKNHLGEASFDRLREGGGQCYFFGWESFRDKKRTEKEKLNEIVREG